MLFVDGAESFDVGDSFLAGFFFFSALSAGTEPPTSTPVTAAGAATLIVSAFVPDPAVAVFSPPELEMANAAPKAATTAMRPMAIERGSMSLGSTFSRAPRDGAIRLRVCVGAVGVWKGLHCQLGDLVAGRLEAAQRPATACSALCTDARALL